MRTLRLSRTAMQWKVIDRDGRTRTVYPPWSLSRGEGSSILLCDVLMLLAILVFGIGAYLE